MKRILITIVSVSFFLISKNVMAQPKAIDLGLSVKWASCNVGTNYPEQYGDYFAWGETSVKNDYSWKTFKYSTSGSEDFSEQHFSKYVPSGKGAYWSRGGAPDNRTRLALSDDAARANWGGTWRTPTASEWAELRTECTWTWTSQGGVNGYKITSKVNGNSIFLPAAGCRFYTDNPHSAGYNGFYWSSDLATDPYNAWGVFFSSGSVNSRSDHNRYLGFSVRPVSE